VVDETGLHRVALDLELGDCLVLGRGEEQSGGREKPSILADTVEALLGALYLDAGFEKTLEIIERLFSPLMEGIERAHMTTDFKSLLQEYTQQVHKCLPVYRLIHESGPAHEKTFRIALSLKGEPLSEGEGKSKKEAEQAAAREAFDCLKKDATS